MTHSPEMPAAAAPPPVLELREVSAGYDRLPVLNSVSISIKPASIVGLLGPNGAGKTTTLRVVSGLLRPSSGTVFLNGVDVTSTDASRRARRELCTVPEGRGIFPDLTVRENLILQLPHGAGRDYSPALDAFPVLATRLRQQAGALSGGEQQMLALARCFLVRPAVVLADEISMGLAPRVIDAVYAALARLVEEGTAVLVVEQYVHRVMKLANDIYLLNQGSIAFSGHPEELARGELLRQYFGAEYRTWTDKE